MSAHTPTVAVLGGGVGGLSAAQELAERGFDVTVYERNGIFGGKARSMDGPEIGDGPALPGEHGFRFFPGFYRHVTDTMARIPYGDGSVEDNLVETTQLLMALTDGDGQTMPTETPTSLPEWRDALTRIFGGQRVPTDESAFFVDRLLYLLTACERRWEEEFEYTTWWEFIEADRMSKGYRTFLGYGVTQSLVAMRPEVSSTRTIGGIYLQMFRSLFDTSIAADRLLNGPTNDVWIDPWVEYLRSMDVDLHAETPVRAIHSDGRRVTGVTIADGLGDDATERAVDADYYVLATPAEVTAKLVTPDLRRAAPSLGGVQHLDFGWMNGLQFYLAEDVPTVHGHGVYYDSPWALTSISQRQFWEEYDVTECGDGRVEGVLSVIVSEWDEPGVVYDKPARECTEDELIEEVWTQLKDHLNRGETVLSDDNLVETFVDPAVEFAGGDGTVQNGEPLLINTAGSLRHRPAAATNAENLTLAADYVRTNSDLASMESANEAARRATNAIVERSGVDAPACDVYELDLPGFAERFRARDRRRYDLGLPHPAEASPTLFRTAKRLSPGGGGFGLLSDD